MVAGQEPPPSKMYVMRGLLMLLGTVPQGAAYWAGLVLDDERVLWIGAALSALSILLLVCHFFVTMELTEDMGRLEVLHLALFWLVDRLPACLYEIRAYGVVSPIMIVSTVFYTYPFYAITDKIRQAVRAHQLRCGTLGEFVDEHMSQVVMFYIPPMLFLTMGSIAALMRLDRVAIGAVPELSEELDDDVRAAERPLPRGG